ncbi:kinase-like protein [Whalleya microplaca]|nr:kinase-like protein [Whalleya microplaca]
MKYNALAISDRVENVELYEPGGFYPLDLGETIKERFKVAHKLGHGGIATKWRAIKINAASHSSEDCPDLKFIKSMGNTPCDIDELGSNHIMVALETFFIDSPNGRHLCFVLPVAGPRFTQRKKTGRQLIEALAFMHNNLLMKLKPGILDHIGYEEMLELVGDAVSEQLLDGDERSPHAPRYVYVPFTFRQNHVSHMISDDIVVIDFGESYEASQPPERLNTPTKYAGPEWLFAGQTGIGNDLWALAYTLLEVQAGAFPSEIWIIIRCMERFIGPVPSRYGPAAVKLLYEEKCDFDEPMPEYQENEPVTGPLTEPAEFSHPLHIALGMLGMPRDDYDSDERLSVSQVLEHDWFKDERISGEQPDLSKPLPTIPTDLEEPQDLAILNSPNPSSTVEHTSLPGGSVDVRCPWYHSIAIWVAILFILLYAHLLYSHLVLLASILSC